MVVNPTAGAGRAGRIWRRIEPFLRRRIPGCEVHLTTGPRDAERTAGEWGSAHPGGLVAVVGGDGTVHEVLNGLLAGGGRCRLAVISAGTGNDIAANLGLEPNPEKSAASLDPAGVRRVDVGRARFSTPAAEPATRFFLNSLSTGVSARANRIAVRLRRALPGAVRYPISGLAALLVEPAADLEVDSDGRTIHRGPALNVTVANGACFGGGLRISPAADPADGTLDLVIIGAISRVRALLALSRLRRGTHLGRGGVLTARSLVRVRIRRASGPLRIELDGENLEALEEVQVEVLAGRLDVVHTG